MKVPASQTSSAPVPSPVDKDATRLREHHREVMQNILESNQLQRGISGLHSLRRVHITVHQHDESDDPRLIQTIINCIASLPAVEDFSFALPFELSLRKPILSLNPLANLKILTVKNLPRSSNLMIVEFTQLVARSPQLHTLDVSGEQPYFLPLDFLVGPEDLVKEASRRGITLPIQILNCRRVPVNQHKFQKELHHFRRLQNICCSQGPVFDLLKREKIWAASISTSGYSLASLEYLTSYSGLQSLKLHTIPLPRPRPNADRRKQAFSLMDATLRRHKNTLTDFDNRAVRAFLAHWR
ncbi:hypothetical protein NP233_g12244 [Leucocoprinus birnbaumii]|uniref:Uncharacterized protein n=1 Tax=Leucocoprinus birnbaumii TaxID=56174 RepID=A0AAD5VGM8_9AGAR|nr:hypothetical protein NP233_g12244 [Leucocoprinus birnbaumii]